MGRTKADVTAKSAAKVNMSIKPPRLQGTKERVKSVADQKMDTGKTAVADNESLRDEC
jgi:hypothetical protein